MLQQYLDVIAAQWPVSSQDHHVQEFLHQGASNEVREQDLTQPFEQVLEQDLRQKTRGDAVAWLLIRGQALFGA
jgi:hypothetical protein